MLRESFHPEPTKILPDPDSLVRKFVRPGMYLHLANTMSRPNALIYALARVFGGTKPDFTISVAGLHSSAHALALSQIVKKVITGFAGDNYPKPGPNSLYQDLLMGKPFELELWSLLTLIQRLMAGAMRLPGIITNSLIGSDLIADKLGKSAFLYNKPLSGNPFGPAPEPHLSTENKGSRNKDIVFLLPLNPEITLVHGVVADEDGNIVLCPPSGEGPWGALAAQKGVIATVEKIVPRGALPPELVVIPGGKVLGITVAKFGAHPQSLRVHGLQDLPAFEGVETYMDDYEFQKEANQSAGIPAKADRWYKEFVSLAGGHSEYLEQLGSVRLRRLTMTPPEHNLRVPEDPKTVNDSEQMIILAARAIMEKIKTHSYKTILAGIGAAHMAAWTASKLLEKDGIKISVVSELGFYGMKPFRGDVFLFSQLHTKECSMLSDVPSILGTIVPDECLGVIGAAEVDWFGNINSVIDSNGKFLVGSGGANDIVSTSNTIVVAKANRHRFVRNVKHVTSPGERVVEAVCQFGRFKRQEFSNHPFELASWIPPSSDEEMETWEAVRRYTQWLPPDEDIPTPAEPPITVSELTILRELDPERIYTEQFMVYTHLP
ncbi:3-oxoacid CoA-transferase [Leptospira perolatii]|uniref:3-oxoacid CoA-transferase n=1 Tax=Leptospira perolatii TaxID=2023191 RepID=A0A2M9ZNK5_9LEPT|nr:CoA-transferase [Leptospira perolatii]PJZ69660.1 3-oxoacid CoA-transferase [Leptospira perolatii]PJZ73647.1 3-oxoacid CoA-transferase [Leptospira perolatii]